NIVNLLLARQVAKRRETAIRRALGASSNRLVQEAFIETAVLSAAGAVAGIAIAIETVTALRYWQPPGLARLDAVHVDAPVLLFPIAVPVLTALAAGLLPAWWASRSGDVPEVLTVAVPTATAARGSRAVRRVLCSSELAISLVLLVGAMLFGRS